MRDKMTTASGRSRTLSANTTSQLNVLGHNGDALCMDTTQVGVLEPENTRC